ncbi:MAG: DUF401 family protein [Candidatus Edwardsbacteria bacterium]|nr:DUF401 family protein [Candidatus Edwardsbacteria bacterium]MBU1577182.1 DUF401 family protein [Candidatus Edwardsbacteria bacterium]MBU2462913.1 DUF401 family protein [Candidatus Edwardsbacteria bacterium]MBU2593281.1 DUF401 family protein [Candidatus Edwardsbacteria bacterium]
MYRGHSLQFLLAFYLHFAHSLQLPGLLISPSHLCLALTREYFKANWGQVYRYLLPASSGIVLLGFLLYYLWR